MFVRSALFGCAAAVAALVTTGVTLAPAQAMTAEISYADLDLTVSAGRAALDRRIRRAVTSVCGSASDLDLAMAMHTRSCRKAALASASRQVGVAVARIEAGSRLAAMRSAGESGGLR